MKAEQLARIKAIIEADLREAVKIAIFRMWVEGDPYRLLPEERQQILKEAMLEVIARRHKEVVPTKIPTVIN